MIFAIDIGNTHLVAGCLDEAGAHYVGRFETDRQATAEEYAIKFKTWLDINGVEARQIEGGIISTVVPPLISPLTRAVRYLTGKTPLVVGPGVRSGLNIKIDNPAQLGADLVANAVAGVNYYPVPQIIIDMGTATTLSVVDEKKQYIGGMILPGPRISLDALTSRASQLSGISLEAPKHIIGKNTIECMKSGIVYSNAAAMDGMIERIEEEMGSKATVIATGGLAKSIVQHCKREIILDEELMLKGLYIIYEKNK